MRSGLRDLRLASFTFAHGPTALDDLAPPRVASSGPVKPALLLAMALLVSRNVAAQTGPGPERTITSVSFRGNHALDDLTLSSAIATSASSWTYSVPLLKDLGLGQRRVFDELEFRRDVLRLGLLYRQHGYFDTRVDTVVTRTPTTVAVVFEIHEGPPVVVDSVAIQGLAGILAPPRLAAKLPLVVGAPFDRVLFEAAADSIALAVEDRGYPFVAVYRNYTVDRTARTASLEYEVSPGPRARIGAISIAGNQAVGAGTIARFLAFRPGDWFSLSALYDSQRSLYETDLFQYVRVGLAQDSTLAGSDTLVRILVQVNEAPRTRLRLGAGYGTIDCVRSQATLTSGDFLGGARRLDLAGKVSKVGVGAPTDWGLSNSICSALSGDPFSARINYLGSATITQSGFPGRHGTLTLTTYSERRSEYKAFERDGIGSSLALSVGVGGASVATLSYRLTYGSTTADTAVYCIYFDRCTAQAIDVLRQAHRQAALSLALVRNTSDSPIEPTRGSILSLEVSNASPADGSERLISYNKLVADGTWYTTVHRDWVLAFRLRGGVIRPGIAFVADTGIRYVPPEERFYAGGPASVRGFGRNEMGPLVYVADSVVADTATGAFTPINLRISPVGSYAITLANLELRIPAPIWSRRLRLALFVDVGELWDQTTAGLIPSGLKATPGLGLRVATPLGPVRLDAAYNGYASQKGPLYVGRRTAGGVPNGLDLYTDSYAGPPRGTSFFQHLQLQFSVGEAF